MIRTVGSQFWTDPRVKKYPPIEKLVFLYLMTNNHTHFSGIYSLPWIYMQVETQLPEKQLKAADEFLQKEKRIFYDPEREVVWVVNMLRHQKVGPTHVTGIANHLASLHDSPLIESFLKYYDTLSIPYIYPTDGGKADPIYPSPSPSPILIPNKERGVGKTIRATGCRIPDDFALTKEREVVAVNAGVDSGKINIVFKSFVNYWKTIPGQKGIKLDWDRTWENWCLNEVYKYGNAKRPDQQPKKKENIV